jgi:flagellar hook-length control protein FliK
MCSFSANGGGEIRIRLKPENLGELHVRVVTDGRNVGLHIQASDEKARKILEESLSHLKDSMATQNLSLGAVDLTVGRSHSSGFGDSLGNQQSQGHGQWSGDLLGGQPGQSHQREGRGAWAGNGDGNLPSGARVARPASFGAAAPAFGQARGAQASANGRLDVTA